MAFYGCVKGTIRVTAGDGQTTPLLIEDFGTSSRVAVLHQAPRTLAVSHMRLSYLNQNQTPGTRTFINNCNGLGKNDRVFRNGQFWVRFINTEWKQSPNFICNGSDMWVFGYKVEGKMTNFEAINGGRLKVLGGICNEHGKGFSPEVPILRNRGSSLTFVGYTNGPGVFEQILEETLEGKTRRLMVNSCPLREGSDGWHDVTMPLLVSVPVRTDTARPARP